MSSYTNMQKKLNTPGGKNIPKFPGMVRPTNPIAGAIAATKSAFENGAKRSGEPSFVSGARPSPKAPVPVAQRTAAKEEGFFFHDKKGRLAFHNAQGNEALANPGKKLTGANAYRSDYHGEGKLQDVAMAQEGRGKSLAQAQVRR